ncbi:hypothetical protein [Mesobacillus harenae]|uniref:hypothetical protein n=1 Tax=Mesobacillus harenae TaxID=2213203 RepID=UPI001580CBA9|nr:hypothetical protein [Mesobacillus harenae]
MASLTKIRFIDPKALIRLDWILLLLSFGFIYFYYHTGFMMPVDLIVYMAAISLLNYLSKRYNDVLAAALGYSLTAFFLLLYSIGFDGPAKLLFFAPFILFFIVLFKNFPSSFLSGILLGYWMLCFYLAFQNMNSGMPHLTYAFSFPIFLNIMENSEFLLMIGAVLFLFSKPNQYRPASKTMKLARTWFWMSIPVFIIAYKNDNLAELQGAAIYLALTWIAYTSLKKDKILLSSVAYAIVAFIACYFIRQEYSIENFYFLLIVPLLVLLLVNYFKISAQFFVGFFLAFWVVQIYAIYKVADAGVYQALSSVLTVNGIKEAISYLWLFLLTGILLAQNKGLLNSIITYLEKLNQKQKSIVTSRSRRETAASSETRPNSNARDWDSL